MTLFCFLEAEEAEEAGSPEIGRTETDPKVIGCLTGIRERFVFILSSFTYSSVGNTDNLIPPSNQVSQMHANAVHESKYYCVSTKFKSGIIWRNNFHPIYLNVIILL